VHRWVCVACVGIGLASREWEVEVKVPPSTPNGGMIYARGMGAKKDADGARGDLIITLRILAAAP